MKTIIYSLSFLLGFSAFAETYEVGTEPEFVSIKSVHHLAHAAAHFIETDGGIRISLNVRYKKIGRRGETNRSFYFKVNGDPLYSEDGKIFFRTPYQTIPVATLGHSILDVLKIFPQWNLIYDDLIKVERVKIDASHRFKIVLQMNTEWDD